MKIIDLLNKIANYDEPIIKIKYQDIEFKFDGNTYRDDDGEGMSIIAMIDGDLSNLNDEIEILEEEKKIPEKLELPSFNEFKTMTPEARYVVTAKEYDVLNDIIDYLKSKGDE